MRKLTPILILMTVIAGLLFMNTALAAKKDMAKPEDMDQTDLKSDEIDASRNPVELDQQYKYLFTKGYEMYSREKYQKACEVLHRFLDERTPDAVDYEWAEFFFGMGLKKLGYSHAAVDILSNLVTRKPNPQIVNYALEVLEQISLTKPFDHELVVNRALCDQNYGFIEDHMSDFVHYYHGEYDWEHGLFEWGDEHFAQIRKDSYYYNKYLFKKALREYYQQQSSEAEKLLKNVLYKLPDGAPLKDDARKTLARIYYEMGKFDKADFLYQHIEMNIVEQAQNLLERAWAHYRMGNPERAMGLLYSFEAPSYTNSFTPEFYILKSFIYKDVCHYKTAMQVLDSFKERYGDALENIYQRGKPYDNEAMLLVILNKSKVKRQWKFINLLDQEKSLCEKINDAKLKGYLEHLYDLEKEETEYEFRRLVNEEYEKMANAMLRFEEEAHLMEYEIGLDMYQRVKNYHFSEDEDLKSKKEDASEIEKAVFAFQGEFWNDELDDYEVVLPNKCQNAEEWDIFFK